MMTLKDLNYHQCLLQKLLSITDKINKMLAVNTISSVLILQYKFLILHRVEMVIQMIVESPGFLALLQTVKNVSIHDITIRCFFSFISVDIHFKFKINAICSFIYLLRDCYFVTFYGICRFMHNSWKL